MDEPFRIFYNTLDPTKFKYFIKGNSYLIYDKDIVHLPSEYKNGKGNSNCIKLQEIEPIIKEMLKIKHIPVEEYQEVMNFTPTSIREEQYNAAECNSTYNSVDSSFSNHNFTHLKYELSRVGFPGDYRDFVDICVDDQIIPSIFAITFIETPNFIQVAYIRDSKIMYTEFTDDDLFSALFSLMNTENCIQVLYNNSCFERIFNSWGISSLFLNHSEDSVGLIRKYMKHDFSAESFARSDVCLVDIGYFDLPNFDQLGLQTQQGKRLLNQWIRGPLMDMKEIEKRLDLTEAFGNIDVNITVFSDLKRIIGKIINKKITVQEIIKLSQTIQRIPDLIEPFYNANSHSSLSFEKKTLIHDNFILPLEKINSIFSPIIQEINNKIDISQMRINIHLHEELIKLEEQKYLIYKEIEKEFLKVSNNYPKVKFSNKLFRITRGEYQKDEFERKNYVVVSFAKTGVHFVTKVLSEQKCELDIVNSKISVLENEIIDKIRLSLLNFVNILESLNFITSLIDIYKAFSLKTKNQSYSRPIFTNDGQEYIINGGFHPLLEYKECILNDINFHKNLCILTGPNMGGKSTFIKSLSMISLYAQIGCYVPAKKAILPIFDRIFLRVGAKDFNSKGQSTFMVEMVELNKILRTATGKSLVLIDELGRGTSALDGLSIILAVKEYMQSLGCKGVMATHFNEVGDDSL